MSICSTKLREYMSDLFKKVLVACSAAGLFGGSVYIGDQIVGSYIRSKNVASTIVEQSEQTGVPDQQPDAVAIPKPKASFSFSFGK
jgi:hypothetical protein